MKIIVRVNLDLVGKGLVASAVGASLSVVRQSRCFIGGLGV